MILHENIRVEKYNRMGSLDLSKPQLGSIQTSNLFRNGKVITNKDTIDNSFDQEGSTEFGGSSMVVPPSML